MSSLLPRHILLTGPSGFLGQAVLRALHARGITSVLAPTHTQCDLRDPARVAALLAPQAGRPPIDVIIHCAGLVGGLGLNRSRPADMLHDNVLMTLNLIRAACDAPPDVVARRAVVLVGSMTSYPADAPLPDREDSLFRGLPDREIAPYGIGKLAGLMHLHAASLQHNLRGSFPIPANLYGPGDNLDDPAVSHVAGALIKRFVDAADRREPEVTCWGSGAPTRDFLFIDDAAEGVIRCAEHAVSSAAPDRSLPLIPLAANLASGREVSIRELAETIARLAGYSGKIIWDAAKGDGVSRRCLDISRAANTLGWQPRVTLEDGLRRTIEWYRSRA